MNSLCNVNQSRTYRYISIDEIQNSIQLYAVFFQDIYPGIQRTQEVGKHSYSKFRSKSIDGC